MNETPRSEGIAHNTPDVKVPNVTTMKAIAELEAGNGKKFASVDDLMVDLHADD